MIKLVTSSEVEYPRMISTNFITGTGFIKCMPITLSGREVTAAICVIEIEEVFVAKITFGAVNLSKSANIFSFKFTFSVAASTTRSTFFTPSSMDVKVVKFASVAAFSASVIASLVTCRSRFLPMVAIPLSRDACEISIKETLYPN